jgi:hypothetical protein
MPKTTDTDLESDQHSDPITERSAYLIPWLERLEMISLKQLSEAIEKKDEAGQQAELDMVRGAIARLVGARQPTTKGESQL